MASSRINQKSEELKMLWRIIYPKVGKPRDIGDNTDIYLSYGKVLTAYVAERKKNDYKIQVIQTDLLHEYRKVMQLLDKESYTKHNGEYHCFSHKILNTLAIAGGFDSWDDYMQQKWPEKYSDLLKPVDKNEPSEPLFDLDACNKIDAFKIGKQIIVGWYPKRYVKFEYLGEYRFKVLESSTRKKYTRERIMYADKFDLEMPLVIDKNDMGYPMWPMIIVSYQGNKKVLNFDKVKKENSNL